MEEITESFYENIELLISNESRRMSSTLFTDEWLEKLSNSREKELFLLLRKIASLNVKFENGEAHYSPGFLLYGQGRTFDMSDMTDEDYLLLNKVDIKKLPYLLRARIANILWNEKKNVDMAEIAIESYHELYMVLFSVEHWSSCVRYIKQSINLALKIGKVEVANKYLQELKEKVLEINGEGSIYFSIAIIGFLIDNNYETLSLISLIDIIINKTTNDYDEIEKAYKLKVEIYKKNKDTKAAKNTMLALAEYLENACSVQDDVRSLYITERNIEKAILIYKQEGKKEETERATKKLLDVQKEIPKFMIPISSKMDVSAEYKEYIALFSNLNFQQAVVRLIQTVHIEARDSLEKRVLEDATNPIACLFGVGLKNSKGQTVINIPPLDIDNPRKDEKAFTMHVNQEAINSAKWYGTYLGWGIRYIKETYDFSKEDLSFLVKDNPIIPQGRHAVFLSAIFYGFKGEMFEALHILAPQMENLFRTIAEDAGSVMSKLKEDLSMEEKLLSSILDDELLWDCYDNDVLFWFKCLLNEKSGANIRNEIAHGIMTSGNGNSAVSIYFYCLVLKMLSFTATEEYKEIHRSIKAK